MRTKANQIFLFFVNSFQFEETKFPFPRKRFPKSPFSAGMAIPSVEIIHNTYQGEIGIQNHIYYMQHISGIGGSL